MVLVGEMWKWDNQFPTIHVPATWTNGSSIFPKPPSPRNNYPFYKKAPIMPLPLNTPIEAYIMSTEQAANKLPSQEADELRSDVNRMLKQLQQQNNKNASSTPLSAKPLQNSNRTTPGWFSQQTRGWPWSSGTNWTTSTKPKLYYRILTPTKYSPRTPPPTSKTNSLPFLRTLSR